MNIVGICASPRRRGNSDMLLDEALKGARARGAKTRKIFLCDLDIAPCRGCNMCRSAGGTCVVKDGMGLIYSQIGRSDGVIIACPIFFGSVPAQLKAMIDRFECKWASAGILNKGPFARKGSRAALLCVSGEKTRKYFRNAREIVRYFLAAIGMKYDKELFCGGVSAKGEIKGKRGVLKKAFSLGSSLAL